MPLGDLLGEALGGALRVAGRILFELVFELAIKGTGYAIIKLFRPRSEPSEISCSVVGLGFWAVVIALGIIVFWQAAST